MAKRPRQRAGDQVPIRGRLIGHIDSVVYRHVADPAGVRRDHSFTGRKVPIYVVNGGRSVLVGLSLKCGKFIEG